MIYAKGRDDEEDDESGLNLSRDKDSPQNNQLQSSPKKKSSASTFKKSKRVVDSEGTEGIKSMLRVGKGFTDYVKRKFNTIFSRSSADHFSPDQGEDPPLLSGSRTSRRFESSFRERKQREIPEFEDFDPLDSKGLISLFWKRDELSLCQVIPRILSEPPSYKEIGPPTYLESIGHPSVVLKGAQIVLTNEKRVKKLVVGKEFHCFQSMNTELAIDIHHKNLDKLVELLGEFLSIIRTSTWLWNNDYSSYFNRSEYNFLKAIGHFAIEEEVKEKRKKNLGHAKGLKEEIMLAPMVGREYLMLKAHIANSLAFFVEIVDELNEFEADVEVSYQPVNRRRNR